MFSVICLLLLNITEHLLKNTEYRGFPVVLSQELRFLVGYVSRRDLSLAISMSVCLSSFLMIHTHYILQSLYTSSCVSQHLQWELPLWNIFQFMEKMLEFATTIISLCFTRLTALCPGLPGWAGTRKVKPIWILMEQETVSGSSISWAICKSAPRSRQITTPAPHHSVFYRPDALPAAQPTASKHWRQWLSIVKLHKFQLC